MAQSKSVIRTGRPTDRIRLHFPAQPTFVAIDSLLKIDRQLRPLSDEKVVFDLSRVKELSPLFICFLGAWLEHAQQQGCDVRFVLPRNKRCADVMREVQAFARTPGRPPLKIGGGLRQLRRLDSANPDALADLAAVAPARFRDVLQRVLVELLTNALDHSGQSVCYCCAGVWGKSNNYHFAFMDLGIGIPNSLRLVFPHFHRDIEALKQMLMKGNLTTRVRRRGGLGYENIRDILRQNQGRLHLVSGAAKASHLYDRGEYKHKQARVPFSGTCVDIQMDLRADYPPEEPLRWERQEGDWF